MTKDQYLGFQRGPRPEQSDQRQPDQAASFSHKAEALRDSASVASRTRFPTGTGLTPTLSTADVVLCGSPCVGPSATPARRRTRKSGQPLHFTVLQKKKPSRFRAVMIEREMQAAVRNNFQGLKPVWPRSLTRIRSTKSPRQRCDARELSVCTLRLRDEICSRGLARVVSAHLKHAKI